MNRLKQQSSDNDSCSPSIETEVAVEEPEEEVVVEDNSAEVVVTDFVEDTNVSET